MKYIRVVDNILRESVRVGEMVGPIASFDRMSHYSVILF